MNLNYMNMDETASYEKLVQLQTRVSLKEVLTPERIKGNQVSMAEGLTFNFAACPVDAEILKILQKLAEEQQAVDKYLDLAEGSFVNTGENRKVLHHLTRGQLGKAVDFQNRNMRDFYKNQQDRFSDFSRKIISGDIKGSTGRKFDTVVQIGIGGSDLGPRAMYLALEQVVESRMKAHFISNVDPDDANAVLEGMDFETSLFILVSKSGTTQETLANQNFVLEKMKASGISGLDPLRHMVAVTSETSPLAGNVAYLDSFYIDDFIGGRYSSTSAVGGVILSLAFGPEVFSRFLDGAFAADKTAMDKDIMKNPALLDALIGVYERNILDFPQSAVLPYSQALSRFPAHLQQLDMESNGKSVNRDGKPVSYSTGPVIFGEPGTNGQHSFYQLLHQGTDITPLQFIGFRKSQIDGDLDFEGSTSQTKLIANLVAQIVAYGKGQSDKNPNKNFKGERPSSLIYGEKLTPETLGALLSHFENKVMFQGFIWNLNSFDQEGVQLGKILAGKVLKKSNDADPALGAYAELLGI